MSRIEVQLLGDSRSLERAFSRSSTSGRGFAASLLGTSVRVGTALTAAATAAAGLSAVGVKSFASFEDTMQRIVGLSGVAQNRIGGLTQEVLKLAPAVGKSPQELAEALFFITSSGISASKAIDVLTNSAKASVAGLGETKIVADAVTSAINAYGENNLSAKKATDVLVAAVREGKGEADALAGSIGNVTALASQLGVKFNEVGSALAAETRLGIDAETASVQLQQFFSSLVKVPPQAAKAFKSVGLSAAGLRAELGSKGLIATLQTIKKAFGDNIPALANAFGNIRALRGVLALVGNSADKTSTIFEHLKDTSTSLKTAFDAVSKDTAQQFRKLKAVAEVAGIQIGAAFAPVADKVAAGLGKAAEVFSRFLTDVAAAKTIDAKLNVAWSGIKDATTGAQNALGDAVDKVDWAVVWRKASGISDGLQARLEAVDWSAIGKTIGDGIATGISGAASATKEIAGRFEDAFKTIDWNQLGRAAGPGVASAMLAAIATLVDPVFWIKNWDLVLAIAVSFFGKGIGKVAGKLTAPLVRLGSRIGGDFALAIASAVERVSPRIASIVLAGLARIPGLVAAALSKVGRLFEKLFTAIAKRVGKPLTFALKVLGVQAAIDAVAGAFHQLGQVVSHALDGAWDSLKQSALKTVLAIVEPFSHLPGSLGGWARDLKDSLKSQWDAMQTDASAAGNAVGEAFTQAMAQRIADGLAATRDASETALKVSSGLARTRAAADESANAPVPALDTSSSVKAAVEAAAKGKGISQSQRNTWFDDAISRMLDRVQDIRTLKGQLGRLSEIGKLISQRIAATTDITRKLTLEDKLLGVTRQQRQLKQQVIDAAQFKTLGLDATGGELVPGVKGLKRQLGSVADAISGSFLDTSKTRTVLANIRKVLAAGIGNVSKDVRAKVKEMLDGIDQQLKDHAGNQTKRRHTSTSALLAGLGLDPEQIRALRPRLAQLSVNGTVPGARTAAFADGGGTTIVLHNAQFHGVNDVRTLKKQLDKEAARRTNPRRGR